MDVGRQCQREEARIQYILEGREEGQLGSPSAGEVGQCEEFGTEGIGDDS